MIMINSNERIVIHFSTLYVLIECVISNDPNAFRKLERNYR